MGHDPRDWMWKKASDLLERADRMHRRVSIQPSGRCAVWQPPADLFESEHSLLIVVALPGVDPERVEVVIERGELVVRGERRLPARCTTHSEVRRLEIPYGRFERALPLPPGHYEIVRNEVENGCLFLELGKL
jgi:HSP20 family molecular chaperone IbpA